MTTDPIERELLIVAWLLDSARHLRTNDVDDAQLQALADGILEGRHLDEALKQQRSAELALSSIASDSSIPAVDVATAIKLGWADYQIARFCDIIDVAARMENRIALARQRMLERDWRSCPRCSHTGRISDTIRDKTGPTLKAVGLRAFECLSCSCFWYEADDCHASTRNRRRQEDTQ